MKNLLLGGALGFCLAVVVLMMLGLRGAQHVTSAPIDGLFAIYADVDEGEVEEVTFRASWIYGRLKDGRTLESYATHAQVVPAFTDRLLAKGVRVGVRPPPEEDPSFPMLANALINWAPFIFVYTLFFIGLVFLIARPMLKVVRQLEAHIKNTQPRPPGRPRPHLERGWA